MYIQTLGYLGQTSGLSQQKTGRLKPCKRDKVPILVLRGVDDEASLLLLLARLSC